MKNSSKLAILMIGTLLFCVLGSAQAQLVANDDSYGVRADEILLVEAFGVLENDTLDGNNAGEEGATAEPLTDVSHGVLNLASDGSFDYTPDGTFDGIDSFTYRAVSDPDSSVATVTLSACTGGPRIFTCWKESAYLEMLSGLGFTAPAGTLFTEGFEDDSAWGTARSPESAPSVASNGIIWRTNWPNPPASNEITTGSGAARTGAWGVYDLEHGYATGSIGECDVQFPAENCFPHDGFTGLRAAGLGNLHGAGGFFSGPIVGANIAVFLDDGPEIGLGKMLSHGPSFFGVIDTGPGFRKFSFVELDGKVEQLIFIAGDDFTFATAPPIPALPWQYLLLLGLVLVVVSPPLIQRWAKA